MGLCCLRCYCNNHLFIDISLTTVKLQGCTCKFEKSAENPAPYSENCGNLIFFMRDYQFDLKDDIFDKDIFPAFIESGIFTMNNLLFQAFSLELPDFSPEPRLILA